MKNVTHTVYHELRKRLDRESGYSAYGFIRDTGFYHFKDWADGAFESVVDAITIGLYEGARG